MAYSRIQIVPVALVCPPLVWFGGNEEVTISTKKLRDSTKEFIWLPKMLKNLNACYKLRSFNDLPNVVPVTQNALMSFNRPLLWLKPVSVKTSRIQTPNQHPDPASIIQNHTLRIQADSRQSR